MNYKSSNSTNSFRISDTILLLQAKDVWQAATKLDTLSLEPKQGCGWEGAAWVGLTAVGPPKGTALQISHLTLRMRCELGNMSHHQTESILLKSSKYLLCPLWPSVAGDSGDHPFWLRGIPAFGEMYIYSPQIFFYYKEMLINSEKTPA